MTEEIGIRNLRRSAHYVPALGSTISTRYWTRLKACNIDDPDGRQPVAVRLQPSRLLIELDPRCCLICTATPRFDLRL